jgi:hypothetical protein
MLLSSTREGGGEVLGCCRRSGCSASRRRMSTRCCRRWRATCPLASIVAHCRGAEQQ